MQKKRICILFVLLSYLFYAFCSCANKDETVAADTSTYTAGNVETEAEKVVYELEIPEGVNYNGYEFLMLIPDYTAFSVGTSYFYNKFCLEENGEIFNDTIYYANRKVEERLNITLTEDHKNGSETDIAYMRKLILAGDDVVDIALYVDRFCFQMAQEGLVYPYNHINTIHLDKPWWYHEVNDVLSIDGNNYFANSYFHILTSASHVLYFNKDYFDDNNYTYPYEAVRSGTWTINAMYKLFADFTNDINGDGKMDKNDLWGAVYNTNIWYNDFGPASGEFIIVKDSTGEFKQNVIGNDRLISIWQKILDYEQVDCVFNAVQDYQVPVDRFKDGMCLFAGFQVSRSEDLRDMEYEFGIVPFPKYEEVEAGTVYNSYMSTTPTYIIPGVASDTERTGVILETLAYTYYTDVFPVYIDTVSTNRNVRDNESAEMLLMMSDFVYPDLARCYWLDAGGLIMSIFEKGTDTFVSTYAAKEEFITGLIETSIKAIRENNP